MNDNNLNILRKKSLLAKIRSLFTNKPKNLNVLLEILQYATHKNLIDNDALHMIAGVLDVQELRAKDVMIPKAQMTIVRNTMPINEIITTITKSGHSRFPVLGDNTDEVLGILLAKDLLNYSEQHFNIKRNIKICCFYS